MKTTTSEPRPPIVKPGKFRRTSRHLLGVGLAAVLTLLCSCGELRPAPGGFEPQAYTPIDYQDLLHPRQAGLHAGQMVRVKANFWQPLDYDPDMVRNYLTLARRPRGWLKLRWFAVYGSEEMQGYYDLAAMDASRLELQKPRRLDPILLYGQIASLGTEFYLHVHHIEKVVEE